MRLMNGFTLIEMMITVTVSAILLGAAAPSYTQMKMRNEVATMSLEFNNALRLAQNEAITRDVRVSIAPHTSSGKKWLGGWNIFVDETNIGIKSATETLIRSYAFNKDQATLTASDNIFKKYVTFLPNGTLAGKSGFSGSFKVCPSSKNKDIARTMDLARSGFVSSRKTAITCP